MIVAGSAVVMSVLLLANLFYGSVSVPAADVFAALIGDECNEVWRVIVVETRLPQAVTALFAGSSIAVAGLVLQTLFNNPLAGPEVLGINSGAGLGVAVVMLLAQGTVFAGTAGLHGYLVLLAGAFIGAMLVMSLILLLSSMFSNKLYLLIAGVAVSFLFSSAISILNYFATSEGVHSYIIWGMGNFGGVSLEQLPMFVLPLILLLIAAVLRMKSLNVLLLGDDYAHNLGIDVMTARVVLLAVTGLIVAVVTAFCGPVTFLGLAVPHIARLVLKTSNHNYLLPATMIIGASVALLCNIICQLPGESGLMPLGAITPLIGAPVIMYVLLKNRGSL
ncbi:MAG: iron ABC transporter permease [Bacteroidaceae bacterium]|nr:iron ABC transporter permease [Bacteroidaceae bacterium]MBR4066850.1 iron ABC transporter permease [Bacteroidaceae bacterium]